LTTQVPAAPAAASAESGAPAVAPASASAPPAPAAASPPATPASDAGGAPPPAGAESAPAPQSDWRQDRINKLTAKLKEEQAKNAELAARVSVPQAPAVAPPQTQGLVPGSPEFQRAVDFAAQQKKELDDWNAMCNNIAADGRTRFGQVEFNKAVADLNSLIDKTDPQSMLAFNAMINAANEAGDGAYLMMQLGSDLNQAAKVLSMNPVKMTAEFTRRVIAAKSAAPNGELTLPKPITPVGGRGPAHTEIAASDPVRSSALATPDWMARREAEVEARRRQKMGLPAA
jgi:hypothetical protein